MVAMGMAPTALLYGQRDRIPPGYPESLRQNFKNVLSQERSNPENPDIQLHLAEIYLNLGDDLYEDERDRIQAYERGWDAAKRSWENEPTRADAHFLYAANLGSLSEVKGRMFGALHIDDIRKHLEWTLQLNPQHAQALQFLGGLLSQLPWMLGGDEEKGQEYLERAIQIDDNFTHARILLAKLLIKKGRIDKAKKQLEEVIQAKHPHYPYTWAKTFRPQACLMLDALKE